MELFQVIITPSTGANQFSKCIMAMTAVDAINKAIEVMSQENWLSPDIINWQVAAFTVNKPVVIG